MKVRLKWLWNRERNPLKLYGHKTAPAGARFISIPETSIPEITTPEISILAIAITESPIRARRQSQRQEGCWEGKA